MDKSPSEKCFNHHTISYAEITIYIYIKGHIYILYIKGHIYICIIIYIIHIPQ